MRLDAKHIHDGINFCVGRLLGVAALLIDGRG